jgi:hypothetical protein
MRKPPAALVQLIAGTLHQDAYHEWGTTDPAALGAGAAERMASAQKKEVSDWLAWALEHLAGGELRGVIGRYNTGVAFNAKGSRAFLQALHDKITA